MHIETCTKLECWDFCSLMFMLFDCWSFLLFYCHCCWYDPMTCLCILIKFFCCGGYHLTYLETWCYYFPVFYTIVIAAGPNLILGSPLLMFLLISGHCWNGNRVWHSSYKSKWSFLWHSCVPNAPDKLIVIHSAHGVYLFLQILRFYASLFNIQ